MNFFYRFISLFNRSSSYLRVLRKAPWQKKILYTFLSIFTIGVPGYYLARTMIRPVTNHPSVEQVQSASSTSKSGSSASNNSMPNESASNTTRNVQQAPQSSTTQNAPAAGAPTNKGADDNYFNQQKEQLSEYVFQSGENPIVVVNQNVPIFRSDAAKWNGPAVKYDALDSLNRTQTATAFLDRDNLSRSVGRERQTWQPTGWHNQVKIINGKRLYPQNRGHLIAYTLTFNLDENGNYQKGALGSQNNPYNLATQTQYANQELMPIYEQKVRAALSAGQKVTYQVTTVFNGNELMPRGYWLNSQSTDKRACFSVYLMNVQNNLEFDYATGKSTINQKFIVDQNK